MYLSGKKQISFVEYDCTSVKTKYSSLALKGCTTTTASSPLVLSAFRLSIALARTILSSNPTNLDLMFQVVSSFYNMQSMITSRGKYFNLNDHVQNKFRDFSFTGRIGELAQGINYLFAQDILGFPIVMDFDGFLASQNYLHAYPYSGQAPDFVLKKYGLNSITLFESKGSFAKDNSGIKTILKSGLEQCENAEKYFIRMGLGACIQNSYASVVRFSRDHSTENTSIHFADPVGESNTTIENPLALLRYHYASWFSLLGYYKQSLELISNLSMSFEHPISKRTFNGESFCIIEFDNILSSDWFCKEVYKYFYMMFPYKKTLQFGISEKVWEILTSPNDLLEKSLMFDFKPISTETIELFSDGTIIFFE